MKKNFIFTIIAVITICNATLKAQAIAESSVPTSVKKGFNSKFKKASEVTWNMDKTDYEATFKQNGETRIAIYSKQGNWVKTIKMINASQLSSPAKYILNYTYPKGIYSQVIDEDSYAYVRRFYVDLTYKQKKYHIVLNPNGEIIKTINMK
jgi:hypothetical protein